MEEFKAFLQKKAGGRQEISGAGGNHLRGPTSSRTKSLVQLAPAGSQASRSSSEKVSFRASSVEDQRIQRPGFSRRG